jgi:protein SCO1
MKIKISVLSFFLLIVCLCCKQKNDDELLPPIGNRTVVNGKEVSPTIRPFSYRNQDSILITNDSLKPFVYITDFFFTSCPSICPKVMKQMLKLHDKFKENPEVKLVSFTIDPKRDNVARLYTYASNLGVSSSKWHFLTGEKDFTLDLAKDYFISALEDPKAPGGYNHSGLIVLVDKVGQVRAYTDGTKPEDTDAFIAKVEKLIAQD